MSKLPGKMTRKQHWVPQFYLRHFADSSGQLHAYSRQKSSFFRTNCENLCCMRDLYEVEHADTAGDATDRFYAQNLIEVKLSEFENRIALLYDRFLERQKEGQREGEGYSDGKAAVCETRFFGHRIHEPTPSAQLRALGCRHFEGKRPARARGTRL